MNLKSNLMKWACLVLALAAVACDDDKKKGPAGGTTEGERTRTFVSGDYASGWKYFLTSSMRTPKPIIKQWCDPLMTFHKHCSCYSLLTLR